MDLAVEAPLHHCLPGMQCSACHASTVAHALGMTEFIQQVQSLNSSWLHRPAACPHVQLACPVSAPAWNQRNDIHKDVEMT